MVTISKSILHIFGLQMRTRNCISCIKCGECGSAKLVWKYVLVKPNSLRRKEMLNGLNQVMGFEQSSKG